jgi:hypothetical protein
LIGYQWMNGIMVGGCIGALEAIDECWSGLGVQWKREITSNGTYRSWDVGSINGSDIPSIEGKCDAWFPLEERSRFCCVDLLDSFELQAALWFSRETTSTWMPSRFSNVLVKMPQNLLSASTTMMRGRPKTQKNWEKVTSARTSAVIGFPKKAPAANPVMPSIIVRTSCVPSFSGTSLGFHMSRKIVLNGSSQVQACRCIWASWELWFAKRQVAHPSTPLMMSRTT